jgi:5-methylcytosine-specific restriction protein A
MGVSGRDRWPNHSARFTHSRRWPALRLAAKRRDGFRCVKCGAVRRLEVDHIQPVRTNPELSFELSNLQTLCASCHTHKTRIECGQDSPQNPLRQAWRDLVRSTGKDALCLSQ